MAESLRVRVAGAKGIMDTLRAVKGMNDILPEAMPRWRRVEDTFVQLGAQYGFGEVRTPVVEPTSLFVRGIGDTTDIVEKEMYTFVDKGDQSLTLRPEGTASAARAYIQHTVHAREPVTKWIYRGPMYRRERPAKGRYRQFYQLGAEVFGDPGPFVDAELIDYLVRFLRELGVQDVAVLLNSLGSPSTRARYRDSLVAYFEPRRSELSEESQARLTRNPLRILDSKSEADQAVAASAPSLMEFLDADDLAHFEQVKDGLDALGVAFEAEPRLVRGLDYYSRTLFEVKGRGGKLGAQDTLCGGGRYDGLVETLGGPPTPAIGFAIGIERVLMSMEEAVAAPQVDVWVAVASPELRTTALALLGECRQADIRADADLRGSSLKSQLKRANKTGARFAAIVGPDEHTRGAVQLRDLQSASQEEIARSEVAGVLRARLSESPR